MQKNCLSTQTSENGIISPLVVRPTEDKGKFEVISGHRRLHAARMLNLEAVPVTVCDVSREEAAIMLVDSNLHREHILPSEKAKAYKLKLDALKAQGKKTHGEIVKQGTIFVRMRLKQL